MELMSIASTYLGYEDHGVFVWSVNLEMNGATQGAGGVFSDTLVGAGFYEKLFDTVGVTSWEGLQGRLIYVLRDDAHGSIRGFANVIDPTKRYLLIRDYYERPESQDDEKVNDAEE